MRTLLDEILRLDSSNVRSGGSCGCGCPSCSGSSSKQWNDMETSTLLDELLYESNSDKLVSAVAFNRKNAASIGWAPYRHAIVEKVLKLNYTPDDNDFAALVADWQFDNGLSPDGKLGQNTWAAMRRVLNLPASKNQPSVATSGGNYLGDDLKSCPVINPGKAKDRCLAPGTKSCPSIPDLMCMRGVNGIPFEYLFKRALDRSVGLERVTKSEINRQQKFVPRVRDALVEFTLNMKKYGVPIKSILTLGSLYCRCVNKTNSLSNHSYGEAIDIAGVRWTTPSTISRVEDSVLIDRNLKDPEQRRLFQRMNACLRLSFPNVIDYHRSDHRDHFHCDLNRGGRKIPGATVSFVQEALGLALRRPVPVTGKMNSATYQALAAFSGRDIHSLKNEEIQTIVFRSLFVKIAAGQF